MDDRDTQHQNTKRRALLRRPEVLGVPIRLRWFIAFCIADSPCVLGCVGYINDPNTFSGREPCGFLAQEIWSGSQIRSITIGDFNGDSRPDIAVRTPEDLLVLLNTGGGNFSSPIRTALRYGSALAGVTDYGVGRTEVAADFNGDGMMDIATSNALLLGKGDGSFQTPGRFSSGGPDTPAGPTGAADLDGDGRVDVVYLV